MIEMLQTLQNAFVASLLVSVACGVIGSLVVVNRMVFIAGGIAHAAFGGIGLGTFFGFSPFLGALGFGLASSLAMGIAQRKTRQRPDTLIGVMWALGMAIGVILVDITPGYKADLMSFLFGSILFISSIDLLFMLGVDLLVLLAVFLLYKQLLAISFDRTFSLVKNLPVDAIYYLMLALTALTVVATMRLVGLILVIALLTIPPALSAFFTRELNKMMGLSVLFGILLTCGGLFLSYALNLKSGATIILLAGTVYIIALIAKRSALRA